jgi:hypothetical protein
MEKDLMKLDAQEEASDDDKTSKGYFSFKFTLVLFFFSSECISIKESEISIVWMRVFLFYLNLIYTSDI